MSDTFQCPFCAEQITVGVPVCPYCAEPMEPAGDYESVYVRYVIKGFDMKRGDDLSW